MKGQEIILKTFSLPADVFISLFFQILQINLTFLNSPDCFQTLLLSRLQLVPLHTVTQTKEGQQNGKYSK